VLGQPAVFSIFRGACAITTSAPLQGLEEIIPKFPKEGEQTPPIGELGS
jgi:hypothetical protein